MGTIAARQLDWVDWLSVIGSLISIATVLWFVGGLASRLRSASVWQALREFDLVARHPWHVVMFLLVIVSTTTLIGAPPSGFPSSLWLLLPVMSSLMLLLSFFLTQNTRLVRNMVLSEIRRSIDRARKKRNQPCSTVRFDVDLIVAINDYSFAVGTHVIELVREAVNETANQLQSEGIDVSVIGVPEGDEIILVVSGLTTEQTADIADKIRRQVKAALPRIPYYREACDFVIRKLQNPPLTGEEKDAIGTVSAGVAAYRTGEEALLSDISSAVKESKFRGRNKTIIYNHGGPSIVRSDYAPTEE